MEKIYVRSGACRMGECGQKTEWHDSNGKDLYVGDVVKVFNFDYFNKLYHQGCDMEDCSDLYEFISVVCSSEYTTYSNGTHMKHTDFDHFIMGIKDIGFNFEANGYRVEKVIGHQHVINGQKIDYCGLNFKFEEEGDIEAAK